MSKTDNMLFILWLLKTRKRLTAKQIAETLEINIRTVYRYIDALCVSGVPIISEAGHNGGYSLLDHSIEVPLFFDLDEQKALIHASIFAKESGYPFEDSLNSAIAKLKMYTNEKQLDEINRHLTGFDVISTPTNPKLNSYLQEIEQSVANGFTLEMEYQKRDKQTLASRHINPYGLIHWKSKWYVIAFCHYRQEIRSFRVDRIESLNRTISTFEPPVDFSSKEFFLKNILPDQNTQENLISVEIKGKEQAINELCQHWLFAHLLVERTNEHVIVKLDEKAIRTYVPYILLSYGKSIQIVEPLFLKERMITILTELLNHYD
ncbi:helix-turn-helix transcriptional regulator [Metabacillus arenae]|uniref:YafY family transcriptional regulator n=1 Tax=Metabacillus arenae TaxID=2771434 RepID=A0A926RW73_9BACI|nr:YafY family protein [Metabacillus arenae]MBD1380478.1 YafY family transcriptional regulator [Metabacillus arenae]